MQVNVTTTGRLSREIAEREGNQRDDDRAIICQVGLIRRSWSTYIREISVRWRRLIFHRTALQYSLEISREWIIERVPMIFERVSFIHDLAWAVYQLASRRVHRILINWLLVRRFAKHQFFFFYLKRDTRFDACICLAHCVETFGLTRRTITVYGLQSLQREINNRTKVLQVYQRLLC